MQESYFTQRKLKSAEKLNQVLADLPPFCSVFFIGIQNSTGPLTRLNYAYDLRLFFQWLADEKNTHAAALTLEDLKKIGVHDMERFIHYISLYESGDGVKENHESGQARKIAAIRMLFKYFYKSGDLESNAAALLELPKMHEKAIIRLDVDEIVKLLDEAESGEGLSPRQKQFHALTKTRDVAMLTLFLSTGIRISECVGLDLEDIDWRNESIRITRKGGNQSILYLGSEALEALDIYLEDREKWKGANDSPALFLSIQGTRITPRSVQNLVKKYAKIIAPLKHITPHKLRSTYGTTLYQETGDIYLVADVLGHKDVNTTKRHYAAASEENRRLAARTVKLRDKQE